MMTESAVTFAVALPTLMVAHHVADHWVQSSCQAQGKAERSWRGSWCCAKHVTTYTLTTSLLLGLVVAVFSLPVSTGGFVAGQAISASTHYWADRRYTLAWLARALGRGGYYGPGGGAFQLDQAFHRFWLFVASLVTAVM